MKTSISSWRGAHPATCSGDAEGQQWPCQPRLEGTVGCCGLMAGIILPGSHSGSLKEARDEK